MSTDLLIVSAEGGAGANPMLLSNQDPAAREFFDQTSLAGLDADTVPAGAVVASDFGGTAGDPDGDLDLFLGRDPAGTAEFYYQNLSLDQDDQPTNHWLRVNLDIPNGVRPWPEAGTLVRIEQPPGTVRAAQLVDEGLGHTDLSSRYLTFGLGGATDDVAVVVRWPDGKEKTISVTNLDTDVSVGAGHAPGIANADATIEILPTEQVRWIFTWDTPYLADPMRDKVIVSGGARCPGATYQRGDLGVTHRIHPDLTGGYHHRLVVVTDCVSPCTHQVTMESAMGGRVSQATDSVQISFCGEFQQ